MKYKLVAQCFLLINYCSNIFRPQFLAISREIVCLCYKKLQNISEP